MNTIENNNILKLPKIIVLLFLLAIFFSLKTSFFLGINEYVFNAILVVVFTFVFLNHKSWFFINRVAIIFLFLLLFGLLLATRGNFNSYIGVVLLFIPLVFFTILKPSYKVSILYYFEKTLSIIILISLIGWTAFLLGVPLPKTNVVWKSYVFENYYLFIYIPSLYYALPRFQCFFIEPGYFGCLCVLMMYLRRFSFRCWQTYVYLIALVLSYSMAGFFLFFIGLLLYALTNTSNIKKIKYILVLVLFLYAFYYMVFLSGENAISSMFAYRLQVDDGSLSGYNRTSKSFDDWWNSYFLNNGNWLFGNDSIVNQFFYSEEIVGVDLRVYIARYGIVSVIFYFGAMLYYIMRNRSKSAFCYLLLFFIVFYRGYTTMYMMCFPILFVLGANMISYSKRGCDDKTIKSVKIVNA